MKSIENLLASIGLLLLRVGFGGMMITHGWPKLKAFSPETKFPDPLGIGNQLSHAAAIGSEFFCAILLVLGLFTRVVSIPLAFTMLVACFMVHANDPFDLKEKAALYLVAFLALILTGGGSFSLDALIWRKKAKKD